jgi:hypothetical protein
LWLSLSDHRHLHCARTNPSFAVAVGLIFLYAYKAMQKRKASKATY